VRAAACVSAGVSHGGVKDGTEISFPPRRAGERAEVDDAEEDSWGESEEVGHGGQNPKLEIRNSKENRSPKIEIGLGTSFPLACGGRDGSPTDEKFQRMAAENFALRASSKNPEPPM
jgi:hypothetical protein